MTTTTHKLLKANELSADLLAALTIAARPFDKRRNELEPGQYNICERVLIQGVVLVDNPTTATAPPDYLGALGYVLSTLSDRHRRRVEKALSDEGFVTDNEQKLIAKELCALMPRGEVERRGAIKGAIQVSEI